MLQHRRRSYTPTSNNWFRPCQQSSPSLPRCAPSTGTLPRASALALAKATTDQMEAALAYLSMIDPEASKSPSPRSP